MQYFVYIIRSENKRRYYIGTTVNCHKRLVEHNLGKTKSTKPYRPWRLVYTEKYSSKTGAYKREWYLKHPKGYQEKLAIIAKYGEVA